MNAREAAYCAVLASCREECYAADFLDRWAKNAEVDKRSLAFARELAYGSIRMSQILDHYAEQLVPGRLKMKRKERCVLQMALYQYLYMGSVPLYALCNESIQLAKKYCHQRFASFLNASLRKLSSARFSSPLSDWSLRYSFPSFFVDTLCSEWGKEKAQQILEALNCPGQVMARDRKWHKEKGFITQNLETSEIVQQAAQSNALYIQNVTQVQLISDLCKLTPPPSHVLDLCAAPGGKTLAIHDAFPQARLFANDVSEKKLDKLKENIIKYEMRVALNCGKGEEYPLHQLFPLVIVDIPCSNSGVFNKRAEARWRLSQDSLKALEKTQKALLARAVELTEPGGYIWLMSCSILKCENESLISFAKETLGLSEPSYQKTLFPNKEGGDGGFAALLRRPV